ncbi:MFS transporter [Streptomyces sp. NPDC048565]|uniref:MFS transporter n=1 Tax=Streptomyces sp. NPDC048565 TaxID=3155266 RepID=UPI00341B7F01
MAATLLFKRPALVGCLITMTAIGALTAAYGPSIPAFKEQQGVNDTAAGAGLAMQAIGAVVGVLCSQPLLRRRGNRAAVGVSVVLVGVGATVVACAPTWSLTLLGAVITGLGLGGCDVLITQLLIVGTGSRGPAMVNIAHACFGVGTAAAPALIAAVGVAQYRILFAVIALMALVAATTVKGLAPSPTPHELAPHARDDKHGISRHRAIGVAVTFGFLALYVTHFGVQSGIGNWEPTVLLDRGYTSSGAALATSGFWLAMVLGRFVAAALSRRMSLATLVVVSCIGMTGSGAVALHSSTTAWAYLFVGFFIGPIFPNGLTWMVNTGFAHGNRFAYVVAVSMVGMALAPVGLGAVIAERGTGALPASVLAISALTLAASLLVVLVTRAGRDRHDGQGSLPPTDVPSGLSRPQLRVPR